MKILTISGSSRTGSKNKELLQYLSLLSPQHDFYSFGIEQLPLFWADLDEKKVEEEVLHFRNRIKEADAVIIATPTYLHNMPAALKNCLEWLTKGGELMDKPVLAITYTPNKPRGEKSMQSLLNSLNALDARVLTTMQLHHTEIAFNEEGEIIKNDVEDLLKEAIKLLG